MSEVKLTEADRRALERMPDGSWFEPRDPRFSEMKNSAFRCERLEERGMLESNVVGKDLRNLTRVYRKLSD